MFIHSNIKFYFALFILSFPTYSANILSIGEFNIDRNGTGTDGWREQGIAPVAELARIRLGKPDILVLVEVSQYCKNSYSINGTAYFSQSLKMPFYEYALEYRIPGNNGEDSGCSTGNSILSRYPMEKIAEIQFDSQCCGFGRPGARNMLIAKMIAKNLYVIATHLESGTSDFPNGIYEGFSVRYKQSQQIANYVHDNIDLNKNCVVVTGDLNMISMIFPYLGVLYPLKSIGFKDAHRAYTGNKSTVPGTGLSNILARLWIPAQLDYILYAGQCSTQNPKIWNDPESIGFSDHSIISTDLILNY